MKDNVIVIVTVLGVVVALLGVVVALCAWLFPFQPIGPSPFDKTPNVSPSPPVERDRGQPQSLDSEQSRLEATAPKQNRQASEVPRRYEPTNDTASQPISIARTATVFDPPSNVRESPNGVIQCSVTKRTTIKILSSVGVYHNSGVWYYTDACGKKGVIHSSQVRGILNSSQQSRPLRQTQTNSENPDLYQVASVFDPPSNVRDAPNGDILCSVTKRTAIRILGSTGARDNNGVWYYTNICGRVGVIHSTQIRF